MVDCFDITGKDEQSLDWFLRAPGVLALSIPEQAIDEEPANSTYAYMEGLAGGDSDDQWCATWTLPKPEGARLIVTMGAVPGSRVARCLAPGVTGQPPWHTLRVRRHALATRSPRK